MNEANRPSGPDPTDELAARLQDALGADYTVEDRLGVGGFAVVFLVRDERLKRSLAVKVLSPDMITSRTVMERFRREAETVAQLSHPNIVPLHFVGQKDDLLYLVMEAVGGGSLAERLEREHRLPLEDASRIFAEVASALAHAHKRGVIHRDIKPQNVLLDGESGRALVTDFGIARTAEGGSLTMTGMIVGTAAYLSPEQVSGETADHRADIYALGVMAYEMIAGRAPFTGPTPNAVLMRRLAGPPEPLRKVRPDVPDRLADLVDGCLATDPAARIANAGDIARALNDPSVSAARRATSAGSRRPAKRWTTSLAALGGTAAVLAAGFAALQWTKPNESDVAPLPPVDSGMVMVPAGSYVIGTDSGQAESRPAHRVQLAAFGIGRHEVTIGEYREFVGTGRATATWTGEGDNSLPVTGVVLAEAAGYCAWKHPDGGRLPTEEEWEAAARGSAGRTYPWGSMWDPVAANADHDAGRVMPAGSSPRGANPEGVLDLIGNVWEWTSSPFRPYGDSTSAGGDLYVIRGGAHNSPREVATSWYRGRARSAAQRGDLALTGFRCVMPARRDSSGSGAKAS